MTIYVRIKQSALTDCDFNQADDAAYPILYWSPGTMDVAIADEDGDIYEFTVEDLVVIEPRSKTIKEAV